MDLEAQLDHLLNELEEVEPSAVPVDLRKNKPPEPPVPPVPPTSPEPAEPEPVAAEPVETDTEPQPVPAEVGADDETVEPVAETSETAEAVASEATKEQSLDADTIAAMASDLLDSQIDSTIEAASVDAAPEEPATAPQTAEASETVRDEPEPVPVGAGPEPEPVKPMSEDELASQLDSLMTQVQNPTAVPAEPVVEPPVSESTESPEAAAEEVTESKTPEPAKSLSEDNLASQLDLLLAEMQNPTAVRESVGDATDTEEAAGAAAAESDTAKPAKSLSEDDLASQLDSLLAQMHIPTATAQAASTDEPAAEAAEPNTDSAEPTEVVAGTDTAADDADAGTMSIDQIDEMLAETAEQAVEHGPAPETDIPPGTDEVLAAQAKAEEEAEARAQADRDAAEPVPVPAEAASAPEPEPVPVPAPIEASEPEPVAVEPQPVPVEAGAAAGGASAADVANELDNDAQASGQPDDGLAEAAFAEPFQGEDGHEAVDDGQVHVNHSGLKKAELAMLMICSKVNKPLNRLSPEMRDSVGYAGLATTGLAFFMLIYGVLF